MNPYRTAPCLGTTGNTSISMLLAVVFALGVAIAALTVYSAFIAYRTTIIQNMAREDAKQVSGLVFEHLYAVMRKGWTRADIDDVIHLVQLRLPHHEVLVVRSESVVQQYGDREVTSHVSAISREVDYTRDLVVGKRWPRELQTLANNFNELMGQIRRSTDALLESSLHDPLTGLFNRRHFDVALEQAAQDAEAGSAPFGVLLIDLDQFKPINDQFGHAAGDAVLLSVAKSLQGALRETDLAARIGGDEFAVLMTSTTYEEAKRLAERLREAICNPALRFGHDTVHPACSIGVAAYPQDGKLGVEVLHAADLAMYTDKARRNAGR